MKLRLMVLALLCMGVALATQTVSAGGAQEKKEKDRKWQGKVVRIYKEESKLDLRGGETPAADTQRTVIFDNSTEWTNQNKPGAKLDDIKEGSFIIVVGHVDEKGALHAKRIDIRLPR